MDDLLIRETEKLKRSWQRHDAAHLGDYLVGDVEDPRINVQSIVMRHFLIEALFGARFGGLMQQELPFAAAMNWLHRRTDDLNNPETRAVLLHALRRGADNAEGLEIPAFLTRLFSRLPAQTDGVGVPNYIEESLLGQARSGVLDTFQRLWADLFTGEPQRNRHLLEAACGSANDYRYLASYGIARLVDYTGIDLCEKNVANAQMLYPGVRFEVGNVFEIAATDRAYELTFVHDLFEHLSPAALPVAVRELCRVTRRGLCAGFFQMAEIPDHLVRPVDEYHWNTLSLERTRDLFVEQGFAVQALHIGSYLQHCTGCAETHNPNAHAFIASRR
jgi:SAM-dependent methyltransferase